MFRKHTKVMALICAVTIAAQMTGTNVYAAELFSVGEALTTAKTSTKTESGDVASVKNDAPVKEQKKTAPVKTKISFKIGEAEVAVKGAVDAEIEIIPEVSEASSEENVESNVQVVEEPAEAVVAIGGVQDNVVMMQATPNAFGNTVSANDVEDFSNLVIAQVNDYVNVRGIPSEEDGEVLGKLYDDSVGEFIQEQDGWYKIKSGSVTGWVKSEYVVTGPEAIEVAKKVGKRIATVETTTLFVREQPTTDSSVIGMVPIEDELSVTEEGVDEGWIKVSVEEGEGYVCTDFVSLSTEFVKAESKAEEEARLAAEEAERKRAQAAAKKSAASKSGKSVTPGGGGSGAGGSVASYALQFVGNPYVYGGSSLTNGTDCSGFVMSVYAHFGVGLPHSSGAQRGCGYDVGGLGNAQPGDIVCYSGHVGIYIGGGQIVHASTAATGIKVSNAGYRPVLSVRRIF